MGLLKDKLAMKIPGWREEVQNLLKDYGEKQISSVTIAQAYGGTRGVKTMICDTSEVPPEKGLIIRGIPVAELKSKLPEEVFFLLVTGDLPDKKELASLQKELEARNRVPAYVWKVLAAMPKDSHPMAMLDTAILVMEKESKFRQM